MSGDGLSHELILKLQHRGVELIGPSDLAHWYQAFEDTAVGRLTRFWNEPGRNRCHFSVPPLEQILAFLA